VSPVDLDITSVLSLLREGRERPALSFYRGKALSGRLTCGALVDKIESLAGALSADLGVQDGDRVAVLAPNRLEIPVLVLALLRLGAVVVPLNPLSPADDWSYIVGHSGARGLCTTRELASRLPASLKLAFTVHVEDVFELQGQAPAVPTGLHEKVGVILYTSGTTGNPKGVALRQRSLLANAASMARNFHLHEASQLAVLPLYHAHAFGFGLMTALSTGGHLVFTERLEPFTWAEVIRSEAVTVTSVVPTLLPMLLAAGITRQKVPTLRHILVSSAPLPVDVARNFETQTQIPLIQGWGLSEYTNFACCMPCDASPETHARLMFSSEVPSVGHALEGSEVRVVDLEGKPVAAGVRGELMVRGPSTMAGYFRDPETTAAALDAEGWLRTGDEGFFRVDEGGAVFFVTGRLKEIIIRDAEKYSPLRIERRLVTELPEVSGRLVVLGFPHKEHGEEVGAYLEGETMGDELRSRLAAAIQTLPVTERPKVVLYGSLPIPRTHTGKIQRRKMVPWFAPWVAHRGPMFIGPVPQEAAPASG
jgi:long-chain acyl-CoA synthetase